MPYIHQVFELISIGSLFWLNDKRSLKKQIFNLTSNIFLIRLFMLNSTHFFIRRRKFFLTLCAKCFKLSFLKFRISDCVSKEVFPLNNRFSVVISKTTTPKPLLYLFIFSNYFEFNFINQDKINSTYQTSMAKQASLSSSSKMNVLLRTSGAKQLSVPNIMFFDKKRLSEFDAQINDPRVSLLFVNFE